MQHLGAKHRKFAPSARDGWSSKSRMARLWPTTAASGLGQRMAATAATLDRPVPAFKLDDIFTPAADQPKAIREISEAVRAGDRFTTLLGATGTGKTMTMAGVIAELQRPTLVLAHNKTLAAQLCNEFRTFFPDNAVEYFVSYYDYYQPEAYVPSRRPLHREGLGDQRGGRPAPARRHRRAVRPPRRDHRGVRAARSSASARPRPTR